MRGKRREVMRGQWLLAVGCTRISTIFPSFPGTPGRGQHAAFLSSLPRWLAAGSVERTARHRSGLLARLLVNSLAVAAVPLFKVEVRVGRLVEARVFSLKSPEDVVAYHAEILDAIQRASRRKQAVLVADHRPVKVYSQPVAAQLVEAFKKNNALVERAASIVSSNSATMLLQFDRLIRESNNEHRKVFRDEASALAFLRAALGEQERERAAAFIHEWTG